MNPRILAAAAAALAWLYGKHVTIWLAGHPATLAAPIPFFAAVSALIAAGVWLIFRRHGVIPTMYWRAAS